MMKAERLIVPKGKERGAKQLNVAAQNNIKDERKKSRMIETPQ
ncbi:hypothetical protein [Methylobacter sp.]